MTFRQHATDDTTEDRCLSGSKSLYDLQNENLTFKHSKLKFNKLLFYFHYYCDFSFCDIFISIG